MRVKLTVSMISSFSSGWLVRLARPAEAPRVQARRFRLRRLVAFGVPGRADVGSLGSGSATTELK
jgi:hypothetical protein